ncbi:MAG: hypothetical protein KDF95_08970, partial [Rhodocyclaceae bacterium]|nr:hypothetical protein [Rhodocyclaceae bacterium]
MFDKILIANR